MKKRVLSAMPSQTFAEGALDAAQQTGELSYDGYKKVWSDEFNGDNGSTKEAASYTSGRVSTQNKQTFIYGRFECRAKVPKGHGYLPAFTLS